MKKIIHGKKVNSNLICGKPMKQILLVGNPNTGKTTLFNSLTKSNEHVGNWHGVTVEEKGKEFDCNGQKLMLVDLPGIYSLSSLSYEEQVAIDYIRAHPKTKIVNIFLSILFCKFFPFFKHFSYYRIIFY